jgi:dihydroflavonol-4-reductase
VRFLVTGATGKIGHAVALRLAERGDDVVALVRSPAKAREALPAGVELAGGDVTDPESVRRAMEGVDGVFNCMGLFEQWFADPGVFERVNAEGARTVIAAARDAGVKRAVHTSTFDVFHAEVGGTVSEAAVADYSKGTAYERSKQHAEELVLSESGRGIEVVIVNPSSVYGPGPWQGAGLDRAFRDAIRRRLPGVPPGGMTLVHANDVAAGQLAAFERGTPGERYILADGYATMRELLSVAVSEAPAALGCRPAHLPALAGARGQLASAGRARNRLHALGAGHSRHGALDDRQRQGLAVPRA